MMVLKSYKVIFAITTVFSSIQLSRAFNFDHSSEDDFTLPELPIPDLSQSAVKGTIILRSDENNVETIESLEAEELENANNSESNNKYEIKMKLGNGVTVGCEVEKKTGFDDVTELYLEDEFGRREPDIDEVPQAMYRSSNSLFVRHPEASADLLEMEVPYGWWPAECIQRIMGLSFENTLCNCPPGPPGLTGRPGPEGPPGLRGPPGNDGKNGTNGYRGPPGDQGPPGTPGSKGRKGSPGSPGSPGSQGPSGPPGAPGRDGRNGVPGSPGAPGQDGKPGTNGRNGKDGRPGLQGPPGTSGLPGNQGVAGLQGEQGKQGIPAPSGPNGIPGVNGEPGIPGEPGQNGQCPPVGGWSPPSSNGWSSTPPSSEWSPSTETGGWVEEIPVDVPTDNIVGDTPPTDTYPPNLPSDTTGWTPDSELSMGYETPHHESDWESPAPAPAVHPGITPAKPAQSAQSSLPVSDYSTYGKPNWGNNPYIPAGAPTQGKPAPGNPHGPPTFHDKRPDYPVSQSFQGSNPLWSTPQFQNNIGMLQTYGQGNGYWRFNGPRNRPGTNNVGKIRKCAKGKVNKVKKNQEIVEAHEQAPIVIPHENIPITNEAVKVPEHETVPVDAADVQGAAPPPSRARVDLDLLD